MIRYADIVSDSIVDGPGVRVTVFLQGCPRKCAGCHNPSLLSPEGGKEVSERELAKAILKKLTPKHGGLTFSGGDPLMQAESLFNVISFIRRRRPDVNIWLYTGFNFAEIKNLPVLKLIDVLVDGPFIMDQKDISLVFRGSANQRIIDMRKTLETGEIIQLYLEKNVANS